MSEKLQILELFGGIGSPRVALRNKDVMGSVNWLKNFIEFAKKHQLLGTGGLDTHSENPFLKH